MITRMDRMLFLLPTLTFAMLAGIMKVTCLNHGNCNSEVCLNVSERLNKTMNPAADPCHDFEEFACGKWKKDTLFPKQLHEMFLAGKELTKEIVDRAKELMEEKPTKKSQFDSDQLIRDFYKSCINSKQAEIKSKSYMMKVFKDLGGFPAIEGDKWIEKGFKWWDMVSKLPRHGVDTRIILTLFTYVEYNDTKSFRIHFDQPSLGRYRNSLVKGFNEKEVQHYYEYMVEAAKILGASNETAHKDMKDALLFEIGLAKISDSQDDRLDESKLYNKRFIGDLEGQPGYPQTLKGFIHQVFASSGVSGISVTDKELVIVKNLEYAKKLSQLVSGTSARAIANYISWRTYQSFDGLMGNDSRSIREDYLRKTKGAKISPVRWMACLQEAGFVRYQDDLTIAASSIYVRNFFKEEVKLSAEALFDDIVRVFKIVLKKNDWMDGNTKKNAIDKLGTLGRMIGYKSAIVDPVVLNNFFKGLKITDDFFQNKVALSKFWIKYYFQRLRTPVDRHHFVFKEGSAIVAQIYTFWSNYVKITAGKLNGVYYNPLQPNYLNYGGIGFVIAQKISNAFDDRGAQFDKNGNLINWWEADTLKKFNEKGQCVVDQYGKMKSDQVGLYLNANRTKGSNIGDIAGAKIAYLAYELYEKTHGPEKPIPGHPYSTKQLFWINFAQSICGKYRDKVLRAFLLYGRFPPAPFRIFGALSNNVKFAEVFNCPKGSRMNPAKKCNVF